MRLRPEEEETCSRAMPKSACHLYKWAPNSTLCHSKIPTHARISKKYSIRILFSGQCYKTLSGEIRNSQNNISGEKALRNNLKKVVWRMSRATLEFLNYLTGFKAKNQK